MKEVHLKTWLWKKVFDEASVGWVDCFLPLWVILNFWFLFGASIFAFDLFPYALQIFVESIWKLAGLSAEVQLCQKTTHTTSKSSDIRIVQAVVVFISTPLLTNFYGSALHKSWNRKKNNSNWKVSPFYWANVIKRCFCRHQINGSFYTESYRYSVKMFELLVQCKVL